MSKLVGFQLFLAFGFAGPGGPDPPFVALRARPGRAGPGPPKMCIYYAVKQFSKTKQIEQKYKHK